MPIYGNQPGNFSNQFAGGLDQVTAGYSITSKPLFVLPSSEDTTGATMIYDLMDADGLVYANGNATSIQVVPQITNENIISTETAIPVPSSIPVNHNGSRYQIRWMLQLATGKTTYYFESFKVVPSAQLVALGTEDVVEIHGIVANPALVLNAIYDNVTYTVYDENDVMRPSAPADNVNTPIPMPEGYQYLATVDSDKLILPEIKAQLQPCSIVWNYWDNDLGSKKYQDSGYIYFVTPSIITAGKDVLLTINKAYISLGVVPDAEFTIPQVMTFLREGMDYFNSVDFITHFDMTRASGGIRDMWIVASCIKALRAQYLVEGEKSFNFSSQAVTLDIDKAQYFESLASAMESELQQRLPKFKQQLNRNGITGGDGDLASTALPKRGSTGALGITITPASNAGALARAGIRF